MWTCGEAADITSEIRSILTRGGVCQSRFVTWGSGGDDCQSGLLVRLAIEEKRCMLYDSGGL